MAELIRYLHTTTLGLLSLKPVKTHYRNAAVFSVDRDVDVCLDGIYSTTARLYTLGLHSPYRPYKLRVICELSMLEPAPGNDLPSLAPNGRPNRCLLQLFVGSAPVITLTDLLYWQSRGNTNISGDCLELRNSEVIDAWKNSVIT